VPITVRDEAPEWLRELIVSEALVALITPKELRRLLCSRLLESSNDDNWSNGSIEQEIRTLLSSAEWYQVYDFCEDLSRWIRTNRGGDRHTHFTDRLNEAFIAKGIGWQLIDHRIETRGTETFEVTVRSAILAASENRKSVAQSELHEALRDLSRRPVPDISGAIQHSMAALECVARDVAGDPKSTLGELIKKNPSLLPPPLGPALSQIWGFASNNGRHLQDGQPPSFDEAELIVSLAGALSTFLFKKIQPMEKP
jgi:hypothetical protein